MTTYSFNAIDNSQARFAAQAGTQARNNAPTAKQVKFYNDLVERKHVDLQDVSKMSFEQVASLINELQKLPDPVTQAQRDKILALHEEIGRLGGDIKPIPDGFFEGLTGGRDGSASRAIEILMKRRAALAENAPASEQQTQTIVSWFLCPDIPFEDLLIVRDEESKRITLERKVYLDELNAWNSDIHDASTLLARPWRLMTPNEFAEQVQRKITRKDASALIDQYRGTFYDWKRTRITKSQMDYIRQLEARMAQMVTPRAIEVAVTSDGERIEMAQGTALPYTQAGYVPLDDFALMQMSVQDAERFIDQLKSEAAQPELRTIGLIDDPTQDLFNEKHSSFDERTNTGLARDAMVARAKEMSTLNDFVFALEAIAGYKHDELHDLINDNIVDMHEDASPRKRFEKHLGELILNAIDTKRGYAHTVTDCGRILSLAEGSDLAERLTRGVTRDLLALG